MPDGGSGWTSGKRHKRLIVFGLRDLAGPYYQPEKRRGMMERLRAVFRPFRLMIKGYALWLVNATD